MPPKPKPIHITNKLDPVNLAQFLGKLAPKTPVFSNKNTTFTIEVTGKIELNFGEWCYSLDLQVK